MTVADGGTMIVKPVEGFVLAAILHRHLAKQADIASATGYNRAGRKGGSESLRRPKPSHVSP